MKRFLVLTMIFSLLTWGLVLPVQAASLKNISDTLSDSDTSAAATHTINWESSAALSVASSTITFTFDVVWGGLDAITKSGVSSASSSFATVEACTGAASEMLVATSATVLTLELCNGDTIGAGAQSIVVTGMTNPAAVGSQLITIQHGANESGKTRVAIIDDVVVTAAVGTSFTFAVAAITASSTLNGDATVGCMAATSATEIPFGTLTANTPVIACQQLTVATNAKNGFTVTVKQDQALTSASGEDIDTFKDGANSAPTAWTAPANTLDTENTYGHMGVTSEDATLTGGDAFGSALYSGELVSAPRQVFMHTGPANGSTEDKGLTKVGYKIEVSALQEAADDYSATLTYVATPTF